MKESLIGLLRHILNSVFSPQNRLALTLPSSVPVLIPHRVRRRLRKLGSKVRNRNSPSSTLTGLETSWNPADTLKALRRHQWSYYDAQYLLLIILGVFSLSIIEHPGALVKTAVAVLLMTALIIPITRQFWFPFVPIATWLIFFYSCQFVPSDWRPPIWVRVLPALENIFYGANLSNILSAHQSSFYDVLAWLPYGIIHFGAPFVCSILMFIFGPPGTVPVFARSFGYMNLIGVIIQLLFPCAPPWYENLYGLAPANYSMDGSPAGLARVDQLFGVDLYTSSFTASPMVFGAFPSLHSGCGTTEALFMAHVFPQFQPLLIGYILWLWWATMYLSHHYAVDLVGGSLLAGVVFYVAKANFLPRIQADKKLRWDYDYVEIGDNDPADTLSMTLEKLIPSDQEDWTVGSSSSFSPTCESPVDDIQNIWEGETLSSNYDSDLQR